MEPATELAREEAAYVAPPPRSRGVVLDANLGVMGFTGRFREMAPLAPWLHAQIGYEVLSWLMILGEGELAFTDTSGTQPPPKTRAFPIFGFGGGARASIPIGASFDVYAQPTIGAMKADIAKNALAILGFRDAEVLNLYFAGRIGAEWFQTSRHLALGAAFGLRDATGFARLGAGETPLVWDASGSIRYAF